MWTDTCKTCGVKIFNEIPEDKSHDIRNFINEMEKQGIKLGHRTNGSGNKIRPICSDCSNKKIRKLLDRQHKEGMKNLLRDINIEKLYICPLKTDHYEKCTFTAHTRKEIIEHIEKDHRKEVMERGYVSVL